MKVRGFSQRPNDMMFNEWYGEVGKHTARWIRSRNISPADFDHAVSHHGTVSRIDERVIQRLPIRTSPFGPATPTTTNHHNKESK